MPDPPPPDESYRITDSEARMLVFRREQSPHGVICEVLPDCFTVAIASPLAAVVLPWLRPEQLLNNIESLVFFLQRQMSPYFPQDRPVLIAVASRYIERDMPDVLGMLRNSLWQFSFPKMIQWYEIGPSVVPENGMVTLKFTQEEGIPNCIIRGCPFPASVFCGDQPLWYPHEIQPGPSIFRVPYKHPALRQPPRPCAPSPCLRNRAYTPDNQDEDKQAEEDRSGPTDSCSPGPPLLPMSDAGNTDDELSTGSANPISSELLDRICNGGTSLSTDEVLGFEELVRAVSRRSPTPEPEPLPAESESVKDPMLFDQEPPSSPRPCHADLPEALTSTVLKEPWRFSLFRP
ncbi:hypothetical protein BJY04DRAFT_223610 [Aspergillus karnatakaensis]|uniref:uncharacterized protein n=1 Tax=Aspergillus karnatakaensis TaxID=1810916 RepID=UPI003CCD837B